jgi:hypothetical protein
MRRPPRSWPRGETGLLTGLLLVELTLFLILKGLLLGLFVLCFGLLFGQLRLLIVLHELLLGLLAFFLLLLLFFVTVAVVDRDHVTHKVDPGRADLILGRLVDRLNTPINAARAARASIARGTRERSAPACVR